MATRLEWKERATMIRRGKRIMKALWSDRLCGIANRNRLLFDSELLTIWFDRHIAKYAAFTTGQGVKASNMNRIRDQFWRDVSKELLR